MVSFEEAAVMLDQAADALPREIFDKLNGGVNLLPASKTDADGLTVMGMYFVDQMGRHVEIYYGSFCQTLGDAPEERWRRELTRTLKHELTHHIENLALDRSLERWDARHKSELLAGLEYEPLEAESILFLDADDAGLAPLAEGLFRAAAGETLSGVRTASAGLSDAPPERVGANAALAAAEYGADISGHIPRRASRSMVESHDAVLCMTQEQGDELAQQYPEYDHRILCLGERDLTPPLLDTKGSWRRTAARVAREIEYLADELTFDKESSE